MKSESEQLSDLRHAVVAMAIALGAALPDTGDVTRRLNELVATESELQAGDPTL